jgi:LacI family transcriptional regulator
VVSDIGNPFLGELSKAIEVAAFEQGYTVLLGNSIVDNEREVRYLRLFMDRQADGLLVVPVGLGRPIITELNSTGLPLVVLDRPVKGLRAMTILADNEGGARAVAAHLVEHGHRTIGCVAGPEPLIPSSERLRGFQAVIAGAGLSPAACPVVRGRVTRAAGYEAARQLLARRRPPTAIFTTTDEQGIGVLRAAADLGRRVPDDVAVASFDGISACAFTVPGLTSASQPIARMGARAVEVMLAAVGGGSRRSRTETMPVELVVRGSCGCPEPSTPET